MNHCHDCNSSYAVPGTCNCFATGGKRAPVEVSPDPYPWMQPTYPPTPWTAPWSEEPYKITWSPLGSPLRIGLNY
jgi:hypothetical protein